MARLCQELVEDEVEDFEVFDDGDDRDAERSRRPGRAADVGPPTSSFACPWSSFMVLASRSCSGRLVVGASISAFACVSSGMTLPSMLRQLSSRRTRIVGFFCKSSSSRSCSTVAMVCGANKVPAM